ncbi:hypothetical protein BN946_scf184766.g42 [Trametes cinnabarina]|uniref:Uncharacterized protein n=1 Tax=Pycnoporus cinnabarinus TaxID=5643 RepID=A0A060S5U6_PYCCI|nr:hypothetical protein BN946_scf184766.g42 [Trametes cinnabarina]
MQASSVPEYRSGFVIKDEALRRYLGEGHGFELGPLFDENLEPESDSDSGSDGESEEDRTATQQPFDLASWRLEMRQDVEQGLSLEYTSTMRYLRRQAPEDTRKRLVMLHALFVKTEKLGERQLVARRVFIPTGSGGPERRRSGPSELDKEHLQVFIEGYNSLIQDAARLESAGLRSEDFQFIVVPENAVSIPMFNRQELDVRF